jgi:hypothetical protein
MSLNLEQGSGLTAAYQSSATATISALTGAATTYTITNVPFVLNGLAYFKATASGAATPTTDGNSGAAITLTANKARAVVWAVNAAGTVSVYAGPIVDYTDTTASSTACPLPVLPGTVCPVAVMVIMGGSTLSGTWTLGSSNWNATGLTVGKGDGSAAGSVAASLGTLPNKALVTG